eukprot:m.169191 g.169191  ORF g.169191 m.169191 type:complete len:417 (+) comp17800_c0_seq3:259-1509(+)
MPRGKTRSQTAPVAGPAEAPIFMIEGHRMRFHLRPCKEKGAVRAAIKKGGGICAQKREDGVIRLAVPGDQTEPNADYFDFKFVLDCVEQGKLLTLEDYAHVTPIVPDSAEGRRVYTEEEDEALLRVHEAHPHIAQNEKAWKEAIADEPALSGRSWQSLATHLRKTLLPKITPKKVERIRSHWNNDDLQKIWTFARKAEFSPSSPHPGGDTLWMLAAEENLVPGRSWSAMKQQYKRLVTKFRHTAAFLPDPVEVSPRKTKRPRAAYGPSPRPTSGDDDEELSDEDQAVRSADPQHKTASRSIPHSSSGKGSPRKRKADNQPAQPDNLNQNATDQQRRKCINAMVKESGCTKEEVYQALFAMTGNPFDALHYLEHGEARDGMPAWTSEHDKLLGSKHKELAGTFTRSQMLHRMTYNAR